MSNDQQATIPDNKHVLELARYELDYRRKKQWDIFAWVVTILISVIGGIIALTWKGEFKHDTVSRYAMASALACLAVYAIIWINENLKAEEHADKTIRTLLGDAKLNKNAIREPSAFRLGYVAAVGFIGVAAIFAVLCVGKSP